MRETCKKQIRRLSGTVNFPGTPEAITELVNALADVSRSPEEAEKLVSIALESSSYCPTPHDIRTLAQEMHDRTRDTASFDQSYSISCRQCGDNGIVQVGAHWTRCAACVNGAEYPEALLEIANSPKPMRNRGMEHVSAVVNIDKLREQRRAQ